MSHELHDLLRTLGLGEDEAELYLALVRHGPATVGKLGERTRVGRTKIYAVLDAMQSQGLVTRSGDRPKVFAANDPEHLFRARAEDFTAATSVVVRELGPLFRQSQVASPPVIALVGADVVNRSALMFRAAKRDLLVISAANPHEGDFQAEKLHAFEAMLEAFNRGVKITHIVDPSVAKFGAPPGIELHVQNVPMAGLVIADDEAVLLVSMEGQGERQAFNGIYSESRELAKLLRLLFDSFATN